MFLASNLRNIAELVENELMKGIYKKTANIPLSIQFIAAYCKILKADN